MVVATSQGVAATTVGAPLRIEAISKSFGGLQALSDVTIAAERGKVLGLIGPNGAGKTTLFNVITGMMAADEGHVHLGETEMNGLTPQERVHAGIARTFQNIRLFRQLSVIENVTVAWHFGAGFTLSRGLLPTRAERTARREGLAAAETVLERVGLTDVAGRVADELSYGNQRRLEIARALATQPSLLLLDEPAAGLNSAEAEELLVFIRGLGDDGLTVVLVEHNMRLVMGVSDQVAVLSSGALIAQGTPEEVSSNDTVREVYLG